MATRKTTSTTPKTTTTTRAKKKPSEDDLNREIKIRAFEIYEKRIMSDEPGDAISDWEEASAEVYKKYGLK